MISALAWFIIPPAATVLMRALLEWQAQRNATPQCDASRAQRAARAAANSNWKPAP